VNWPAGESDELRRLRVLRAALPGTMLADTVLPVGFDWVWSVISDVETSSQAWCPMCSRCASSPRTANGYER
jgi:hypothetical protein